MIQPRPDMDRRKTTVLAKRESTSGAAGAARRSRSATTLRLANSVRKAYDLDDEGSERILAAGLLLRVRELLLRELDVVLSPFETSHARYQVLAIVCRAPEGLQLSAIAARAFVHPTTMTSTIDRLVRDGLIDRKPDPSDRRSILAVATTKGRERYEGAHAQLAATAYALAEVDSEAIRSVIHGLDRIAAAFEDRNPTIE